MERLGVINSRKLAGPASLANILKTVDNVFANNFNFIFANNFNFIFAKNFNSIFILKKKINT